jgi:hypothetical protein
VIVIWVWNQEFSKIDFPFTLNHGNQKQICNKCFKLTSQSVEKPVKNSCMVEFTASEQLEICN